MLKSRSISDKLQRPRCEARLPPDDSLADMIRSDPSAKYRYRRVEGVYYSDEDSGEDADLPDDAATPWHVASTSKYKLNDIVTLHGLTATQYNGLIGVVVSPSADADGRYQINVSGETDDARFSWTNKVFKIKPANMAMLDPNPNPDPKDLD